MVEVFKTNVEDFNKAQQLIQEIQTEFENCYASFDLEDCDRVLVVRSNEQLIDSAKVIGLLKRFECIATVLPDVIETR